MKSYSGTEEWADNFLKELIFQPHQFLIQLTVRRFFVNNLTKKSTDTLKTQLVTSYFKVLD